MADTLRLNPDILQVNEDGVMTPSEGFAAWARRNPEATGMIIGALTHVPEGEEDAGDIKWGNRDRLSDAAEWAVADQLEVLRKYGFAKCWPEYYETQTIGLVSSGIRQADELLTNQHVNQPVGAEV